MRTVTLALALLIPASVALAKPENLARRAKAWASSEYSSDYAASGAIDGVIAEMASKADLGHAWAVNGAKPSPQTTFILQWPQPVPVAEIIYYGRTAWLMEECFRGYEVYLDDAKTPAATGRFEMNAGPQRIKVGPATASKITLQFLSSYGGSNSGAEEIEVYSESPRDEDLPKLTHLPRNLAPSAQVSASSEFAASYSAAHAVDGAIPEAFMGDDPNRAWAVNGNSWPGQASFTLQWAQPVSVADVVYWGRTSFAVEECFKDYELWLDGDTKPAAKGTFQRGAGPQEIRLAPRTASKLTLKFLNSYGGSNPGAAEIQVLDGLPPADWLPKFQRDGWDAPTESPRLAADVREGRLGFDKLVLVERHELNPSHVYTACCEGFRPGGGLYVLAPPTPNGKLTKLVDSPDGQILDCDVSYDGKEILFSWRRSGSEPYHLFRVNADGTGLRQLTSGRWHDYNACWLPDGGIAFISTRATVFALCFVTPSGVLYRMDRDGGNVRRLSANYVNDFTPSVRPDGRILYSRWEYVDRPAIPIQKMWTINPDGTDLKVFYGNRTLSPASLLEAKPVPGGETVLCTLTSHNGPIRGAVGLIDRRQGVNAQEAIRNLTPGVAIGHVNEGDGNFIRGAYENPCPLDPDRFLVSAKGNIYASSLRGDWAVVRPRGSQLGFYCPTPLRARLLPPVIASALPKDAKPEATLCLVDVYKGLEPQVKRGEVKQIAVVEEVAKDLRTDVMGFGFQRPVISCGATYAVKKVWGYAKVEQDGSAYFTVPTGKPIYFEALDASGQAVQRMRSFTHLMPGETQSCLGCHESRTMSPARHRPVAALRGAEGLTPPEWGREGFDYARIVQPVFDRNCARCHSGVAPAGKLDLTGGKTDWFNVSYDMLTRGRVSWIDTRNGQEANILQVTPKAWGSPASKLASVLISGHPGRDGQPRIRLQDWERRRILAWIDLNVPYYGTYEMSHPDAEGGRRICPASLDARLGDVARRRCAECHQTLPTAGFVRLSDPAMNDFLLAPLAKAAGGRGSCGRAVFADTNDPDYKALLTEFNAVDADLKSRPRIDMPGGKAVAANRSCE